MQTILESILNYPGNHFNDLKRVSTHKDFDLNSKEIYYVRQSKPDGKLSSKDWQGNIFSSVYNTIYSKNSAYKKETSSYILKIIKRIFNAGNNHFLFSVADNSRFSRSEFTTLEIYHFLMVNKDKDFNFYLEINNKIYNYREDYYDKLLAIFKTSENHSKELSRLTKNVKQSDQNRILMKKYSDDASNYFKSYISYANTNFRYKLSNLNSQNFTQVKLEKYAMETRNICRKYNFKKTLYYFYCNITKLMIVCPRHLATVENLDYRILKNFSREDLLKIAKSGDRELEWICYPYNSLDTSALSEAL